MVEPHSTRTIPQTPISSSSGWPTSRLAWRPDRFQRLDAEGRRSSNGWNVHGYDVPTVGRVARSRTDPRASRGGTPTPAGRPPALRAVMRPAPTRTRRASEAVTAAASRVHRICHGPCFVLATLGHVPRQLLRGRRCRTSSTRQRASHPRGFAARPIPDADARLRAMSQNLRSQVLRQALRLFTRATVIHSATLLARFPRP